MEDSFALLGLWSVTGGSAYKTRRRQKRQVLSEVLQRQRCRAGWCEASAQ